MAMESSGSVSGLIDRLKASGEPASVDEATQELWRRVSARLVALARRKMKSRVGLADEEDLALSTFHHVYREMRAGKHEWVDDRNDLWRLFMTITAEKVSKLYRDMSRQSVTTAGRRPNATCRCRTTARAPPATAGRSRTCPARGSTRSKRSSWRTCWRGCSARSATP
ncbi:MAG: ECF-type sigma factor [Isosphaeraceae bacterium]